MKFIRVALIGFMLLCFFGCIAIPVAADNNTTTTATTIPTTTTTTVAPTTTATTIPTTTATPLVALFTASPTSGTAPLTVQFRDTSTGSPTTWDWNFGDGDSSNNENPSYVYTTAGTYYVQLTIGDGGVLPGSTSTQTTPITVTGGTNSLPVVTSISPTYGPISTGTTITITGTGFTGATGVTVGGTAAIDVVVVSSTEITATTPASSTAGPVDVIVSTPEGTSTAVAGDKYNFAAAATSIPVPIFYATPTSGTAPLEVTFTDESTGNPASWSWTFGDGNTSTLQNPTNTYATDGTYTVSLTEVNSLGTNETTMTGYIVVGAATPVAAFSASPLSGLAPLTVQFVDQSTNSPTQWEWSFGDGSTGSTENPSHIYTNPGTYTATLVSMNSLGSSTNGPTQTITVNAGGAATTIPTFTTAPTFAVGAESTTSSVSSWLAQQQAIATVVPTHKSPGYDAFVALIGCGIIAGITLHRKK
ncbi:MAG: PKD domain-containing protein [Methanoregula sp.]